MPNRMKPSFLKGCEHTEAPFLKVGRGKSTRRSLMPDINCTGVEIREKRRRIIPGS